MSWLSKLFGGGGQSTSSAPKPGKNEPGRDLAELARRLKSTPEALLSVKPTYRELAIPKRDGTKRLLLVPDDALKTLQRTILHRLLGRLSAHPAATGFEKGQSIATNASIHVGAAILLKLDIRDFFTKTTGARIRAYFIATGWSGQVADLLVQLTTHKGGLPQGAPTSPRLSNLVNILLDARLSAMARRFGFAYTRYADDMTFSLQPGKGMLNIPHPTTGKSEWHPAAPKQERACAAAIIQFTQRTLESYGYHLHTKKKLRIARPYERMLVTGLVVNKTLNLPRTTRRKLRAVEHHLKTGKPATLNAAQLKGWRAFEAMVTAQRSAQNR